LTTGSEQRITLSGGAGLRLGAGQDRVKVVASGGSCADAAAGGTVEVNDLLPGDASDAIIAIVGLTFSSYGTYRLCYKPVGGAYKLVGVSLNVTGMAVVAPTGYTTQDVPTIHGAQLFSLTGGSGLDIRAGRDMAKMVAGNASNCSVPAAGGTSEVSDLGPDEANSAVLATASFNFTTTGTYQLCYKAFGGNYGFVGSEVRVLARPQQYTSDGSVTAGTVEPIVFAGGSGLRLGAGQDSAKMVSSAGNCSEAPVGGTVEVTDLGPDDSEGTTTATASFTFSPNSTGVHTVCYRLAGGSYSAIGQPVIVAAQPVGPRAFSVTTAPLTAGTLESFMILSGGSLNRMPSGDRAKVISSDLSCAVAPPGGGSSVVTDLGPDDEGVSTFSIA